MKKRGIETRKEGNIKKLAGIVAITMILLILVSQNAISIGNTNIKKNITKSNITKIDLSIGSSGSGKSLGANVVTPKKGQIQLLKAPPKFTTEQIKQQKEFVNKTHLSGPRTPTVKKPLGPTGNATVPKNFLKNSNKSLKIQAPGDFYIFQNSATGMGGSTTNEPSVATNGNVVFYTGNWYAALSRDGGNTFSYISPYADMPTFCCDQDVIYDSSRDIFIWYRQGTKQADGTNFFRMYIISSQGDFLWFWDFAPTDFDGTWTNQWWDYPQLALSNNYLIISSNMFDNSNACGDVGNKHDCWTRTVLMRMPLDQLSTGSTLFTSYIPWTNNFNFGLTSGDTDIIYWGSHNSNTQLRVFSWPENSRSYFWNDVNIDAWDVTNPGDAYKAHCAGPDNLNWCARADDRIAGGWLANGLIGFFWNVKEDPDIGFNYPYINSATFLESDKSYHSRPYIYWSDWAYQYGNVYPNVRGDLGGSFAWGGGNYYPGSGVLIYDGYDNAPPPWDVWFTAYGVAGGYNWGDYLRVRPYLPSSRIWIASGYTVQNTIFGTTSVDPRYIVFGRAQDVVVPLRESLDYNTAYLGTWITGGRAYWYGQTWNWITGFSAVQSDKISDNQITYLQDTVNGPGTLTFAWTVSSEIGYDFLQFYIDGVFQDQISGTPAWQDQSYNLGPGSHTITWIYTKDISLSYNQDAGFVDYFRFTPGSISRISLSPNPINYAGSSKVTVSVKDPNGNPISGANVAMSTSGGSINPISGTTGSNGLFVTKYFPPPTSVTTNYNIHASVSSSNFQSSAAIRAITVKPAISIPAAVDNSELKWTTGGNKHWFGESTTYYNTGGDAAQSGPITNNQNSWLYTNVTGPGILKFVWRTESQVSHDFLNFYIDGTFKNRISGYSGWQSKTYKISPGKHTLKWIYIKDASNSAGYDAGWLDKVNYTSIVVTSPNGGEIWKRGTARTIKWNFTDSPGSRVKIYLYKGGIFNRAITSSAPIGGADHGTFNWNISPSQVIGSNYRVNVISTSNPAYQDSSNKNFTITS